MILLKYSLVTTAIVLSLALPPPVSAQTSRASARNAAERFYRTYLKLQVRGLPDHRQLRELRPLVSNDLQELFAAAIKTQATFIKQHPDEKPPWGDGDLFSSLFEGAQSFTLGAPVVRGKRAEVPVHLVYSQGGQTTRWSDLLVLEKVGRGWRVWDIVMKGEWAFKSGSTLRKILSSE